MLTPQSLPWIEPLDLAAHVDEAYWVLLYSATQTGYSGRYSYLACQLAERIESADFSALESKTGRATASAFDNAWFGWLGYGLKNCLEVLPTDQPNWLCLPAMCMMRFHCIYQFDHTLKTLTLWADQRNPYPQARNIPYRGYNAPAVEFLDSPMSDQEYKDKVAYIIELIHSGELYQANLTRKFIGHFNKNPNYYSLYRELCRISPAPYSAFIRYDDTYILSSSPELFLRMDNKGYIEARPIKGTAPRYTDPRQDEISRAQLAASSKDKAENLMITDLMRNDLAHSCIPGSIQVKQLFEVTSHTTIHHMSSTITGTKRSDSTSLDAIKSCFPPGSMTGAPKIRAMKLCSALEQLERGVYSGAIGWLGGDGSFELSVVIRTLLMKANQFEFQVGGAIVADSTPEHEYRETLYKAKGILTALGLTSLDNPHTDMR